MVKEKDILIRVTKELKDKLSKKASSMGLSISAYVRMIILREL